MRITAVEFVNAYMSFNGDSAATAKHFGTSQQAVRTRVGVLRKRGVKLPVNRKGNRLDIEALNTIVRSYKGK